MLRRTELNKTSTPRQRLLIVGLSLIALLNISSLLYRNFSSYRLQQKYESSTGIVVDITRHHPQDSEHAESLEYHYAVVEFITEDGKTIVFKDEQGSDNPQYQPGQVVPILYNKERPHIALIDSL